MSPENSYVTIGNLINTSQFVQQMGDGSRRYGTSYSSINIYIELWTCNEKYFSRNKSKNKFGNADKIQVARMELFTDFKTLTHPGLIYESDYDGDGHIRNWGPGILKNYIQSLMSYLNRADGHWLYSEIQNANEMKQLKNETLYVPDYVLIKFNQFTGDESKKHDESDIFGDYSFKYKIIPTDSLNKKILTEKSAFYYLIYIKSSTDKYVTVINSSTGEIIYSNYTPVSFNIKSGDLKTLRKKIS